jgi:hypothetical protein
MRTSVRTSLLTTDALSILGVAMRLARTILGMIVVSTLIAVAGCTQKEESADLTGTWTGVSYSHKSRTLDGFMMVGYTARGDFWFTVNKDGIVSGYAIVNYQPITDVSGVNARINAVRATGSSFVGALGPIGVTANMIILTVVGVEVNWTDPLSTQQGPITGTAGGNGLELKWAADKPVALKASVSLVHLDGPSDVLQEPTFVADSPWPAAGSTVGDGRQIVSTGNQPSTDGDVKVANAWSWSAHHIG